MLNRAFESDLINKNVAVSVNTKIDGTEQPEKRVLTPDEIQILLSINEKQSSFIPFCSCVKYWYANGRNSWSYMGMC